MPLIDDLKPLQAPTNLCIEISPIQPKQLELEILPPERILKKSPSVSTLKGSTPKKRKAASLSRLSSDHRHNKENVFFKLSEFQATPKVIPLLREESCRVVVADDNYNCVVHSDYGQPR